MKIIRQVQYYCPTSSTFYYSKLHPTYPIFTSIPTHIKSIIYTPHGQMHQQYLNLLVKFYTKMTEKNKQAQLLAHSLQRFLGYEFKQEEKIIRQREKEGSDYKSYKSGDSASLSDFQKVKKVYYSSQMELCVLFCYMLSKLKNKEAGTVIKLLSRANEKAKGIEKGLSIDEKRRYTSKVSKMIEHLQFLETKVAEGRPIDWLFLQSFKEFESQAVLTALVLTTPLNSLQSKESLKNNDCLALLKALKIQCRVFDYINRQSKNLGSQSQRIYLGRRSDTFFILSEKQYEKANIHSLRESPSPSPSPSPSQHRLSTTQQSQQPKSLKKYSSHKFKEQFLLEMAKLRQGYESNTAIIASLFGFKDANQGQRTSQEGSQA